MQHWSVSKPILCYVPLIEYLVLKEYPLQVNIFGHHFFRPFAISAIPFQFSIKTFLFVKRSIIRSKVLRVYKVYCNVEMFLYLGNEAKKWFCNTPVSLEWFAIKREVFSKLLSFHKLVLLLTFIWLFFQQTGRIGGCNFFI